MHVIERGNNRQACFVADEDHAAYVGWLKEYSAKYNVEIHAWVMMTNYVHLLCTPVQEGGISQMMQSLGRRYVQYFNSEYRRSGTLWEGRFKSCLVQEKHYLLEVYKYIEFNPVRAEMVADPGEYVWSRYQTNGLGKTSELCTPHQEYMLLGSDSFDRQQNYRELFTHHAEVELLVTVQLHPILRRSGRLT